MRGRRGQSWLDLASEMGIVTCQSPTGCPKAWGRVAHLDGRVDHWGFIHWYGFTRKRVTIRGLRHFLKLVALVFNQAWLDEPEWLRLYHTNVWAYKEAQRRYHLRLYRRETRHDRERLLQLARKKKVKLRSHYVNIYVWAREGVHQ